MEFYELTERDINYLKERKEKTNETLKEIKQMIEDYENKKIETNDILGEIKAKIEHCKKYHY